MINARVWCFGHIFLKLINSFYNSFYFTRVYLSVFFFFIKAELFYFFTRIPLCYLLTRLKMCARHRCNRHKHDDERKK